jgi:hypothetical protein
MLPPKSFGHLLLVAHADDADGTLGLGVVRASEENVPRTAAARRTSTRAAASRSCGSTTRQNFRRTSWSASTTEPSKPSSRPTAVKAGVNELLRRVTNVHIGRNTIATLGRQAGYLAHMRDNGRARTVLRREGNLPPGGDYDVHKTRRARPRHHRTQARTRVFPSASPQQHLGDSPTAELEGRLWRVARPDEPAVEPAPKRPETYRRPRGG